MPRGDAIAGSSSSSQGALSRMPHLAPPISLSLSELRSEFHLTEKDRDGLFRPEL